MTINPLVDGEIQQIIENAPGFFSGAASLPVQRTAVVQAFELMCPSPRAPQVVTVPTTVGTPDVALRIYRPKGSGPKPVIYHMHGGGFVMGSAAMMDGFSWQLAESNDAIVIAVEYRLAPETAFPGPLEDCYAGLLWVFGNAGSLGADSQRVVVMGESGGGGLAAALSLLARDRVGVRPAGQLLLYPMLDHRLGVDADRPIRDMVGQMAWVSELSRFGWEAMRGHYDLDDNRAAYFSPALAVNLAGLPPTFVAVGALDVFMEQDLDYAVRVARAGVSVECHVYPGAVHGFDKLSHTRLAKQLTIDQQRALARWFGR
jgi:acetyl esterase